MFSKQPTTPADSQAIMRLTALWALSESGIGGVLFALKIPLTGFLLGAIALVVLSLIAHFSHGSFRQIIGATLLVLSVKAICSPHSSPAAYLAVGFQGLSAAVLYSTIPLHRLATILLGILSMVESASQKIIVMTLIMGKAIWQALSAALNDAAKFFGLAGSENSSYHLLLIYIGLYALWGIAVGWWAGKIPQKLAGYKVLVQEKLVGLDMDSLLVSPTKTKNPQGKKWFGIAILFITVVLVFALAGFKGKKVVQVLTRSLAAIVLLFFVLRPVLKFLINKYLISKGKTSKAQNILAMLPATKEAVVIAYNLAKHEKNAWSRWNSFLNFAITLTLYPIGKEAEPNLPNTSLGGNEA